MTSRRRLVKHNGKTIIFLDHTHLEGKEYVEVIEESYKMANESSMADRLILVDSTESVVDKDVLQALKKLSTLASPKLSKTAVLGATGIQLFFMKTVARFSKTNIRPFNTKEKALKWLTED